MVSYNIFKCMVLLLYCAVATEQGGDTCATDPANASSGTWPQGLLSSLMQKFTRSSIAQTKAASLTTEANGTNNNSSAPTPAATISPSLSPTPAATISPSLSPTPDPPATSALDFCDVASLGGMRGFHENYSNSSRSKVEEDILRDIMGELNNNNVDQMANDVFSFFVCVRWVPDASFRQVMEQEMLSEILKTVVSKGEEPAQALAELYQNFKFIPLLCSTNVGVFEERNVTTGTYFETFKWEVRKITSFLNKAKAGKIWADLVHVDQTFCNSDEMNNFGCEARLTINDWLNQATNWFGGAVKSDFEVKGDRWQVLQDIFTNFTYKPDDHEWNLDFNNWKMNFPYHSFLGNAQGAPYSGSPRSMERFMICFGKRVASELHRRPEGRSIITDQNAVGCHGWWSVEHAEDMLNRMVDLWKPPTCQIAEKAYIMKKQILLMYANLNKELFSALPSMLQDEEAKAASSDLDITFTEPPHYSVTSVRLGDTTYYRDMRVASLSTFRLPLEDCRWWNPMCKSQIINAGDAGYLDVGAEMSCGPTDAADCTQAFNSDSNSDKPEFCNRCRTEDYFTNRCSLCCTTCSEHTSESLRVLWDKDPTRMFRAADASNLHVVPQEYGVGDNRTLFSEVKEGYTTFRDAVRNVFNSLFNNRMTDFASMISGSYAKWVVCHVEANASYSELDNLLGTEDAALQDITREAYSSWTGYTAKIPGEQCTPASEMLSDPLFEPCEICEFSELHADHKEKYYDDNLRQEDFICPLVPPLPYHEQIEVFKQKTGKCMVHMSEKDKRRYRWFFQGHFPARTQHKRQGNDPRINYQLVKTLEVQENKGPQQTAYAKTCSLEEYQANPFFCDAPEIAKQWNSVEQMANAVGAALAGAIGMPFSALTDLVAAYQTLYKLNASAQDKLESGATEFGEQALNALLGVGRLAGQTVNNAIAGVVYELEGSSRRQARLENEIFGYDFAGDFLHGGSFQRAIGANDRSSNAKDRYQRYAVMCPCKDFDPALEMALRWSKSELALRALKEAPDAIIAESAPWVEVRGEARMFINSDNRSYFAYGAAFRSSITNEESSSGCHKVGWGPFAQCQPTTHCEMTGFVNRQCTRKKATGDTDWRTVLDKKLAEFFGGNPVGQTSLDKLTTMTMRYYCGPKSQFNTKGEFTGTASGSIRDCAKNGMKANTEMKALQPWKTYFPDEVVIVVHFTTTTEKKCYDAELEASKPEVPNDHGLCQDATHTPGLDAHLGETDKTGDEGFAYRGFRVGAEFPPGATLTVTIQPEDVLEVADGTMLHER